MSYPIPYLYHIDGQHIRKVESPESLFINLDQSREAIVAAHNAALALWAYQGWRDEELQPRHVLRIGGPVIFSMADNNYPLRRLRRKFTMPWGSCWDGFTSYDDAVTVHSILDYWYQKAKPMMIGLEREQAPALRVVVSKVPHASMAFVTDVEVTPPTPVEVVGGVVNPNCLALVPGYPNVEVQSLAVVMLGS